MSSIKDQLLQMGLVTPAQADETKADGAEKRAGRRGRRGGRGRGGDGGRARADAPATGASANADAGSADDTLIAMLVAGGRLDGDTAGRRRFYYETRGDRVHYLELADAIAARLEKHDAAICEAPDGTVTLVDGETARRIAALDRRWLRN